MDFWRTVLVLFRRWYITFPAFLMTLALAGAAYSSVPVEYQSNGVLVLTTPLSGGTQTAHEKHPNSLTNPLMNFDRSLALAASIVIQEMNSAETASQLGVTFGDPVSYQVTNGSTNPELLETGPFIFIGGTGPSPEAAQDIAKKASTMVAVVLDERQKELNAPPSTHISVQVVVPPTTGQPLLSSPMRAAAAAGALAGLTSLAAVYCFESFMTRRRRRREEKELASVRETPVSTTTRPSPGGTGGAAVGVLARRPRLRVNGVSAEAATSAVGLLEGPDTEHSRADRPDQNPATEEG